MIHRRSGFLWQWRSSLLLAVLFATICDIPAQQTLISTGSTWRYHKGTNEASTPTSLWRTNNFLSFNDTNWPAGVAPFHYGTNTIGGDDNVFTGTVLSDMKNLYRCVFLRNTFLVTNVSQIQRLQFNYTYDDGYIAWINGIEVSRAAVSGQPTISTLAAASIQPAATGTAVPTNILASYLVAGTNVLAVQAFNATLSGSDFRFDTSLVMYRTNEVPKNDNFANRQVITNAVPWTVTGSNVNASVESGEPKITLNVGGASVWWSWTAPYSGAMTLTTAGQQF